METDVMRGIRAAGDLLLPRNCIVCGKNLYLDEKFLCLRCLVNFPFTHHWKEMHNGLSSRFNAGIQRHQERKGFNQVEKYAYGAALFFYQEESDYRHITQTLKYQRNIPAGYFFSEMLAKKISEAEWFNDIDTIIPVPLHWTRRWRRGYNQAEIIAYSIGLTLNVNVRTDILIRSRRTKTQTKLKGVEKARNVSGAFKIKISDPGNIKHILLVDDVFTTGSTLLACFEALREVFPPSVRISVATLAFVGE